MVDITPKSGNNQEQPVEEQKSNNELEQHIENSKPEPQIQKTDAWSYLSSIFNLNWSIWNKLWWFLSKVRLTPYYIFSWFIWLCWLFLIPKWSLMVFWKILLPLIFWFFIIGLFIISWTYISLPSIDNLLFWNNFFPTLWLVIWWIFFIVFCIMFIWFFNANTSSSIKNYWWDWWNFKKNTTNKIQFIAIIAFILMFVIIALSFWNKWDWQTILYVFWENAFWYFAYFLYIFLLINLLMMLYKKIIYIVFSILNKETRKIWWHLLSIAIYISIILIINWFLEISLITIW